MAVLTGVYKVRFLVRLASEARNQIINHLNYWSFLESSIYCNSERKKRYYFGQKVFHLRYRGRTEKMRRNWRYISRGCWSVHLLGPRFRAYPRKQNYKVSYKGGLWKTWTVINSSLYSRVTSPNSHVTIEALQMRIIVEGNLILNGLIFHWVRI